MTVGLTGFFFVVPAMITLMFLLTGSIPMQIQIWLEEEFLLGQHGETDPAYKNTLGRIVMPLLKAKT